MYRLPKNLSHDIHEKITPEVEIECRIQFSKTDQDTLKTLEKYFDSQKVWKKKNTEHIDFFQRRKRITFDGNRYFDTTKGKPLVFEIYKTEEYTLKFNVSKENLVETKQPKSFVFSRAKTRTSFVKGNISVDLTRVVQSDKKDALHEIEVEIINPERFNHKDFTDVIFEIVNYIQNPGKQVISFFNKSIGSKEKEYLDFNFIPRPRDLGWKDLTNDGILESYAVMPKIDGVSCFIVMYKDGIYMLTLEKGTVKISEPYKDKGKCIFQGELVNDRFYIFDCIVFDDNNMTRYSFLDRYKACQKMIGSRFGGYNIVKVDMYYCGNSMYDFFTCNRKIFSLTEKLDTKTDGVVYKPVYGGYYPRGQKDSYEEKILSNNPDICKHKKKEDQTIDFLVKDGKLYTTKDILFTGTEEFPFTSQNYCLDESIGPLEGKIVEFKPFWNSNKIVYKPSRFRDDKKTPNNIRVAISNWLLLHNPIPRRVLIGKGSGLVYRYQQKILHDIIKDQKEYVIDFCLTKEKISKQYSVNENIITMVAVKTNVPEFPFDKKINFTDYEDIIKNSKKFFPCHFYEQNLNINIFFPQIAHGINEKIKDIVQMYQERDGKGSLVLSFYHVSGKKIKKLFTETGEHFFNNIKVFRTGEQKFEINSTEYPILDFEDIMKDLQYDVLSDTVPDGQKHSDYILSDEEIKFSKLFRLVKVKVSQGEKQKEYSARLPVDISNPVRMQNGMTAKGDDRLENMEHIFPGIYRIATIDDDLSLTHSVLKLVNENYRKSNMGKRKTMADKSSVIENMDLDQLSDSIGHSIVVYDKDKSKKIYGKGKEKNILLYINEDETYEPLVHIDPDNPGKMSTIFSKDSVLVG